MEYYSRSQAERYFPFSNLYGVRFTDAMGASWEDVDINHYELSAEHDDVYFFLTAHQRDAFAMLRRYVAKPLPKLLDRVFV